MPHETGFSTGKQMFETYAPQQAAWQAYVCAGIFTFSSLLTLTR
jgi:hypothetical protein